MHQLGIFTIAELRGKSMIELAQEFGKVGSEFYHLARGVDFRPVDPSDQRKSVSRETTFAKDIASLARIKEELKALSIDVAAVLETEGLKGRTITLKGRYPNLAIRTRSMVS